MGKTISKRTSIIMSSLSIIIGIAGFISFGYINVYALIPLTLAFLIGLSEHHLTSKYGSKAMARQQRPGVIISLLGIMTVAGYWVMVSLDFGGYL